MMGQCELTFLFSLTKMLLSETGLEQNVIIIIFFFHFSLPQFDMTMGNLCSSKEPRNATRLVVYHH